LMKHALLLVALAIVISTTAFPHKAHQVVDWCVPDLFSAAFEGSWVTSSPIFLGLVNSDGYVSGMVYHFANDTADFTRFDMTLQSGVTATIWSNWVTTIDDPDNGNIVILSAVTKGSTTTCKLFTGTQVENSNALEFCTVQSGLTYTRDIDYAGGVIQRWFTPKTMRGGIMSVDVAILSQDTVIPVSHFLAAPDGTVSFTHALYDVQFEVNSTYFNIPTNLNCQSVGKFEGKPSGCPFIH